MLWVSKANQEHPAPNIRPPQRQRYMHKNPTKQTFFVAPDSGCYIIAMIPTTQPRPAPTVPRPTFIPFAADGGFVGELPIKLPELIDGTIKDELGLEVRLGLRLELSVKPEVELRVELIVELELELELVLELD